MIRVGDMHRQINTCCDFGELIDYTKMEIPPIIKELIYFDDFNFWSSAAIMVFNPLFWNVVGRLEYRTQILSRLSGSPKISCTFLAVVIFHLMLFRSRRFQLALQSQPTLSDCLSISVLLDWFGIGLIAVGMLLVLSSFYALGFFGTYLGDYFGILMESKVTSFPFNVTSHPMYYGSFLEYLGTSLWYKSPAGFLLSILLLISYLVAISFEEPFTAEIYRQKEAREGKKRK